MANRITQDMRYRQSFMNYAENMVSAAPAGNTTKPLLYLLLESPLGQRSPWPAVRTRPPIPLRISWISW